MCVTKGIVESNVKAWDQLLHDANFSYNKTPSKTTGMSPFKIVYGIEPLSLLDLSSRVVDVK